MISECSHYSPVRELKHVDSYVVCFEALHSLRHRIHTQTPLDFQLNSLRCSFIFHFSPSTWLLAFSLNSCLLTAFFIAVQIYSIIPPQFTSSKVPFTWFSIFSKLVFFAAISPSYELAKGCFFPLQWLIKDLANQLSLYHIYEDKESIRSLICNKGQEKPILLEYNL